MLDGVPIRWRLALLSAGLTLVILSGFAVVIGQVTSSRVRSDFNNEEAAAVDDLSDRIKFQATTGVIALVRPDLDEYAASNKAVIRIAQSSGFILRTTKNAPNFGINLPRTARLGGFRVETRRPANFALRVGKMSPKLGAPGVLSRMRPSGHRIRMVALPGAE